MPQSIVHGELETEQEPLNDDRADMQVQQGTAHSPERQRMRFISHSLRGEESPQLR
jgi:hypothetical protein